MKQRDERIERLRREDFDLAIIGGGINGAAIARDAAMRGLAVALIEKGDFAGATSSSSSKLIHGGLRYLAQGRLRPVYAALRERERLRQLTAPHLVHPIRFLFPFYRGRHPGRYAISAGLILYDLLARPPRPERHRRLNAAATLAAEPMLAAEGLAGGGLYYDAWGDDARLTLENVLDAEAYGAAVCNYVALGEFARAGTKIVAACVRDVVNDEAFEIRARRFVNAAGPWLDDIRRLDDPGAAPSVRLTKGVHLILAAAHLPVRNPLVLESRDGRIVFVMPRDGQVIIGTTDTDHDGGHERLAVEAADIGYLLDVVVQSIPGVKLTPGDISYSFAGLRALKAGSGGRPSSVSREDVVSESAGGLLSVGGGKLTTHRELAERIVDRLVRELGINFGDCATRTTPLPGARPLDSHDHDLNLPPAIDGILSGRYGSRAAYVKEIARAYPELARPLAPDCAAIGAEVIHTIRHEFALSVSDFLVRRTALVWRAPAQAVAAAPTVARIMGAELGWDGTRQAAELGAFFRLPGLNPEFISAVNVKTNQPDNQMVPAKAPEPG